MRTRLVRESLALPYQTGISVRALQTSGRGKVPDEVVPGWRCEFRQARGKVSGKAGAAAGLAAEQGLAARLAAGLTAKQVPGLVATCSTQKHRRWLPAPALQPKTTQAPLTSPNIRAGPTCDPPLPGASRFRRFRSYPTFPPAPHGPLRHPPPPASTTNSERGLLPQEIRPFTGRGRPCGRPLLEKPT